MKRANGFKYQHYEPDLKKTTSLTTAPAKDNHQTSINYLKLHIEAVIESKAWTKGCSIAFSHDWVKTRHAVCRIMSKVYPALLKWFTIRLKRSEKFGFPMIFFLICNQISIEFLIRNTLFQKSFFIIFLLSYRFKFSELQYLTGVDKGLSV